MIWKIIAGLVVGLLAAQLVRPARNLSVIPGPNDISVKQAVPPAVQGLLQRACYDCHSNNTKYPWYSEVQPVRWWLDSHIKDGKRHLDFSEFGTYTAKRANHKMKQTAEQVESGEMPLPSYTWMHPEARLTPQEVKLLADWARATEKLIPVP